MFTSARNQTTTPAAPRIPKTPNTNVRSANRPALFNEQLATPRQPHHAQTAHTPFRSKTPTTARSRPGTPSLAQSQSRGKNETCLMSKETHAVFENADVPAEVREYLRTMRGSGYAFSSVIDQKSSYAVIITHTQLLAWQYGHKPNATRPYDAYPVEQASNSNELQYLPKVCIVPSQSNDLRKPSGLLACTVRGDLRYWQSLVYGPEHRKDGFVEGLEEGEWIQNMVLLDKTTYMAATNLCKLFKITIPTVEENPVTCEEVKQAKGWRKSIGLNFLGWGGGGLLGQLDKKLVTVVKGGMSESDVTLVSNVGLHIWSVSRNEVGHKLVTEQDLLALIKPSLQMDRMDVDDEEEEEQLGFNVQILDADRTSDGKLCLLVSFLDEQGDGYRHFALVILAEVAEGRKQFVIHEKKHLEVKRGPEESNNDVKLHLSDDGITAFVVFPHVVVVTSTASDVNFEDDITLGNMDDQIVAFAAKEGVPDGSRSVAIGVSSGGCLLKFLVDEEKVRARKGVVERDAPSEIQKGSQAYEKLEQAVYYPGRGQNTVVLDLGGFTADEINEAAVELADSILRGDSAHYSEVTATDVHLQDRLRQLDLLLRSIIDGSVKDNVTPHTIESLLANAEKIYAALKLWEHLDKVMAGSEETWTGYHDQGHYGGILDVAIKQYLNDVGQGTDDLDVFFRKHVANVAGVLEHVQRQDRGVAQRDLGTVARVQEGNKVFLMLYFAARDIRQDWMRRWGFKREGVVRPWLAADNLPDNLQEQYELTCALFPDERVPSNRERIVSNHERVLSNQAAELADELFGIYEAEIQYLGTQTNDANAQKKLEQIVKKKAILQPQIIAPLVKIGRTPEAFNLAEKYKNFAMLAKLSVEQAGYAKGIEFYVENYKRDFAFELFEFYLAKGAYQALLTQPRQYGDYVDEFLKGKELPQIKWIQDVGAGRFGDAHESLTRSAKEEDSVVKRRLALNLSKLAYVASLDVENMADFDRSEGGKVVQRITKATDSLGVLDELRHHYAAYVEAAGKSREPFDRKVTTVMNVLYGNVWRDQNTLARLMEVDVRRIMGGEFVGMDALVDLLTLGHENQPVERGENFEACLEGLWLRARLEERDVSAGLRALWRRAWLSVDWEDIMREKGRGHSTQHTDRLRHTIVYRLLLQVKQHEIDQSLVLPPSACVEPAPLDFYAQRLATLPPSEHGDLARNIYHENQALDKLVREQSADKWFAELCNYANQEAAVNGMELDR
ncbi:hypothetical protein HK097_006721 [Rhizophlyctis rosea]|uniref:Nuclear pore complex protein Nup133 n=1 Tax=Rhizophlyctis rosea TaxID=64517 RepID=A0AAD5X6C4_9FUNG|nr:hypothetical protein HK097_006721 [Rhizophlyctis rosea]